jgi:hypothetical protein
MHMKLPSTATVLATIALFVSLTGTAVAAGAVPLAKKSLFANNAGKLQNRTAAEIAAAAGPASTAASLVSSVTSPFSLASQGEGDFSASCPSGSKAVSGGYTYTGNGVAASLDTRPTSDTTWTIYLFNPSDTSVTGSVYAICVK